MPRSQVTDASVLIGVWMLLYVPYILAGGLVRDDLGFLAMPHEFPDYGSFQVQLSSWQTMTARPVSALLHGLCYWFFGSSAWPFHLVNLSLFLASVLFVYRAVSNLIAPDLAFLTAALALIYPCASGTLFSSIMMNSNLAGSCWAAALWLDSTRPLGEGRRWGGIAVTLLLLVSALSYEAFIPLFAVNILVLLARRGGARMTLRGALRMLAPVGLALLLLLVYRVLLEPRIFETEFSRIKLPDASTGGFEVKRAFGRGITVAFADSIRLSVRSLAHLERVALPYFAVLAPGMIGLGVLTYRRIQSSAGLRHRCPFFDGIFERFGRLRAARWPHLGVFVLAVLIFLLSLSIYVFSDCRASSRGFETRTQGGVRFAWAFVLAAGITSLHQALAWRRWKRLCAAAALVLLGLFMLSIVVQRDAWISASRHNDLMLQRMDRVIRSTGLDALPSFTFLAELPQTFPEQVNREPTFGVPWDLGPALSLRFPEIEIQANVYTPERAAIQPDGVTIDRWWEARFPFFFFRHSTEQIYSIASAQDLHDALNAP